MVRGTKHKHNAPKTRWPLMDYARWDPAWMLIHRPEFVKGQVFGSVQVLVRQDPKLAWFWVAFYVLFSEYVDEAGRQFEQDCRDSEPDFGAMGHDQ